MSDTKYNLPDVKDALSDDIVEKEEIEGAKEIEKTREFTAKEEESIEGSIILDEEDEDLELIDEEDESESNKELEEIYEKIKQRKLERKIKRKKREKFFIVISVFAILVALSFSKLVNVDRIVVKGNDYFLKSEIISMSHAKMGNNLIYKPGKIKIKSYLMKNPYIEKVSVRRRLPSTLVIKIKEREQLAAVPYDDEYIVTDINRTVLRKTTDMPRLTVIDGIKIKKMTTGEKLEGEDTKHINDSYELLRLMKDHKLFFKKINVYKDDVTIYVYDNLICTGKTADVKMTIEKNRMQEILKTLIDKDVKRGKIIISENGYAAYSPYLD